MQDSRRKGEAHERKSFYSRGHRSSRAVGRAAHTGLEKEAIQSEKVSPEFSNVNPKYLTRYLPLAVSSKMGMDCSLLVSDDGAGVVYRISVAK